MEAIRIDLIEMSKSNLFVNPDTNYTSMFHSPGVEQWILGLLLDLKPRVILDVGCGYGFWGFIIKRRLNYPSYIVGFDIDNEKVSKAKVVYDDIIIADAKFPPFREKSLDAILAIEVLHFLREDSEIVSVFEKYKSIARKVLVVTFPHTSYRICRLFRELHFETYRYMFRGLAIINRRCICTIYNTTFYKLLNIFLKFLVRIFPWITDKGYMLAIWGHK